MKYPPRHHLEYNFENIIRVIQHYPLATVITTANNQVFTTHIPLIYEKSADNSGSLCGHIDINNPQSDHLKDGAKVSVIFHGPDTYISPSIYSTKQLPTWNYIKVHIEGVIIPINDRDAIKESIVNMTSFLEGAPQRFVLDKEDQRMERLVDFIKTFRIRITHWEGKFKLSQDKSVQDQELAKEALAKNQQNEIDTFLNDIFENHHQKD